MVDIAYLGKLADAARAEVARGEMYGDARVAFLIQFEDEVLFDLVDTVRECVGTRRYRRGKR